MEDRLAHGEALTTNWAVGWSCDLELGPLRSWIGAAKIFKKYLTVGGSMNYNYYIKKGEKKI